MGGKYLVVMSEVGLPGEFAPGLWGSEVPVLVTLKLIKKQLARLIKVASVRAQSRIALASVTAQG